MSDDPSIRARVGLGPYEELAEDVKLPDDLSGILVKNAQGEVIKGARITDISATQDGMLEVTIEGIDWVGM